MEADGPADTSDTPPHRRSCGPRRRFRPFHQELSIGSYIYRMEPANPGVVVHRQCTRGRLTLVQATLIADATEFDRWCDREPTRFEDPQLHQLLRRAGHELLHCPE